MSPELYSHLKELVYPKEDTKLSFRELEELLVQPYIKHSNVSSIKMQFSTFGRKYIEWVQQVQHKLNTWTITLKDKLRYDKEAVWHKMKHQVRNKVSNIAPIAIPTHYNS